MFFSLLLLRFFPLFLMFPLAFAQVAAVPAPRPRPAVRRSGPGPLRLPPHLPGGGCAGRGRGGAAHGGDFVLYLQYVIFFLLLIISPICFFLLSLLIRIDYFIYHY